MSASYEGPVAVLFSGQGVQAEGMGKEAYKRYAAAKEVFSDAEEVVGVDFAEVCFGGLGYLLERPEIAQTAIATVSLAEYRAWVEENQRLPDVVTGMSMGLYTALSPTRVLASLRRESDQKAIDLVHKRARIMQEVAQKNPGGGMGVILGARRHEIAERLPEGLKIAVSRGLQHFIISGPNHDNTLTRHLQEWGRQLGERKAKLLPISMAAHHPAQEETIPLLAPLLEDLIRCNPHMDFLGNSEQFGYLVTPEQIIRHLLSQMVEEAQFDWTASQLARDGIKQVVEFGDPKRGLTRDVAKVGDIKAIKFPLASETSLQTA